MNFKLTKAKVSYFSKKYRSRTTLVRKTLILPQILATFLWSVVCVSSRAVLKYFFSLESSFIKILLNKRQEFL